MIYYNRNNVVVRDSVGSDIEYLKDKLRESDVQEIWASHNHTPGDALKISVYTSSPCLTIENNGFPVGMFGVSPETMLGNKAVIWLLASEGINSIKIRFLRHCKYFINLMLNEYEYLYNFVDERNVESVKWLKYLGAKMSEPVVYGVEKMRFIYFSFERTK